MVSLHPRAFCSAGTYDGPFFMFDLSRITLAPDSVLTRLRETRFMHHSGGEDLWQTTNYYRVVQLVSYAATVGIGNEFPTIPLSPNADHNWWWADEHIIATLPLHWQRFQDTSHRIPLQLLSPTPGAHLAGTVNVLWSLPSLPPSSQILLEYSGNGGRTWNSLFAGPASTTSFAWNTTGFPDGVRYLLRVSATADTAYGVTQLASALTIDNPGNGAPAVEILSPAPGASLTGVTDIAWWGGDPEGDPLTFAIDLTSDGGATWDPIITGLTGVHEYAWDSRIAPNTSSAGLRIRCSDGQITTGTSVLGLSITNPRPTVAASSLLHVSGHGDGVIIPHIVNPLEVVAHEFQVTFQDSGGKATRFNVRDLTVDSLMLSGYPIGGPGNETPVFRGLRLAVTQIPHTGFNPDSSRWLTGTSNLQPQVRLPTLSLGNGTVTGYPYLADYLLTLYDHVIDTSSSVLDAVPIPMKFTVRNLTDKRNVSVVYGDADGNGQISMFDELVILEPGVTPAPGITWDLFFQDVTGPIAPQPGDAYFLKIMKPLTARDTIRFTPVVTAVAVRLGSEQPGGFALYQNFPNPFNPSTTIRYGLPHKSAVRLTVFNTLGQQVATLVQGELEAGYHEVRFDASGMASGVYFYRITAGAFVGTKKLLLIR
jgi:hypothetical protein